MAIRPVLDSDVLIDYLRGRGPGSDLVGSLRRLGGYRVTSISMFELAVGRSYERHPEAVHAVTAVEQLALTPAAALRSGEIFRALRSEGQSIDIRDAFQAGTCIDVGAPLITRNVRHFERVPSLQVVHPQEWAGNG